MNLLQRLSGAVQARIKRVARVAALCSATVILASCGGGSGSSDNNGSAEKVAAVVSAVVTPESASPVISAAPPISTFGKTSSPDITVVSLQKVSETRINRTTYDYAFKVTASNSGAAQKVLLTLIGGGPGTSVIQGNINFDTIKSGASATSPDLMVIRQDRSLVFDPASLAYTATVTPVTDPTMPLVVSLPGIATVEFPVGSLDRTVVNIAKVTSPRYSQLFAETAGVFPGATIQNTYQITVDIPDAQPLVDTKVTLSVPNELIKLAPANSDLRLFYLLYSSSAEEGEITVEPTDEHFSPTSTSVTASVPAEAFTRDDTRSNVSRAVFYLGFTPGHAAVAKAAARSKLATVSTLPASCPFPLMNPISPDDLITSHFGFRISPIDGKGRGHKGIDFRAADGTPVLAMADGTVTLSSFQKDPDTGFGWGNYVVVTHTDGSQSLYAHLTAGTAIPKGPVVAGQQIALSDTSGGAKGPHLHVEFAPDGKAIKKAATKIDFESCIVKPEPTSATLSVLTVDPSFTGLPATISLTGLRASSIFAFQSTGNGTCGFERGSPAFSNSVSPDAKFYAAPIVTGVPQRVGGPGINRNNCSSFVAVQQVVSPTDPTVTKQRVWINGTGRGVQFGGPFGLDWEYQVRFDSGDPFTGAGKQCDVGTVANADFFGKAFSSACSYSLSF